MKILLLGGGGREHALAWKIAQSKKCSKLFIAPGNAGTANCGENIDIKADDFESLKNFCVDNTIDIVVVGPEDPLVKGIYDDFKNDERTKDIPVIGPSKAGAVLEGSKDFAKGFMQRHNIPTAKYQTFDGTNIEEGLKFLETLKAPYVLKADGLCAGKGVLILPTLEEAKKEFQEMITIYQNKDIEGMLKMMSDSDNKITSENQDILLNDRNKNWIPIMVKTMKDKPTFFGVGAGHLAGEEGVIKLLRKKGYKVEAVQ